MFQLSDTICAIFLSNIYAFIDNNEIDKAKAYINEIISNTDKTSLHKYCENRIVNMILSYYNNKFEDNNIEFNTSINIPDNLPYSDVDLTSILSNGIENAVNAVLKLDPSKRTISLDLKMNNDKLLLSIKNPYEDKLELTDGIPTTNVPGHGLGIQSIRYVTEKLSGNCRFVVDNNIFILQVVL